MNPTYRSTRYSIPIAAALAVLFAADSVLAAFGHDASRHWRTAETEHFAVHFHDGEEALALEAGRIAEAVHDRLTLLLGWRPLARTEIVLTDGFDLANGSAQPIPRNQMTIIVAPPDESPRFDHDGWLELLITHEYTHILHLDQARDTPGFFRSIFGRFPLLFPNAFEPPWIIEGLATYFETDSGRKTGRGQNAFFKMLMRLEVSRGVKPLRQVNQPLVTWPGGTTRYLYGVYFFQFLSERYGSTALEGWLDFFSRQLIPYRIDSAAQAATKKNIHGLWLEFQAWLPDRFDPEIASIRGAGLVEGVPAVPEIYTRAPEVSESGDLYYIQNSPDRQEALMRRSAGDAPPEKLFDVFGGRFELHPEAGILVTQIERTRNTNLYYDIYRADENGQDLVRLTYGGRYPFAAWSPDGQRIAAIHHRLGRHALHLLDRDGNLLEEIWIGGPGDILSGLDWSPNGESIISSVFHKDRFFNLEQFFISERRWVRLTADSEIEEGARFGPTGRDIYFSAEHGGVYNLRRLDLETGAVTTLTNVLGGAFEAKPDQTGGTLVYTAYRPEGFQIYRIPMDDLLDGPPSGPSSFPETFSEPSPPGIDPADARPYNALLKIAPTSWFPQVLVSPDRTEIGFVTAGRDPLGWHTYTLAPAYDFRNQWGLGGIDYFYDRHAVAFRGSLTREVDLFLDENDEPQRFRSDLGFRAELIAPFLRMRRQTALQIGTSHRLLKDEWIADGIADGGRFTSRLVGLAIGYHSARRYPDSVSPADGRRFSLVLEDYDLIDNDFSGDMYRLDWQEWIGLPGRHVIALGFNGGWGIGRPQGFRLGGLRGNETLSVVEFLGGPPPSPFDRRRFSLRGYPEGLDDLSGRRFILYSAEWRFPIVLIERGFIVPPVGLHQLHGAIFYESGDAWNSGSGPNRLHPAAGIELRTEIVLGYWIPLSARLGYAHGFARTGEDQVFLRFGLGF